MDVAGGRLGGRFDRDVVDVDVRRAGDDVGVLQLSEGERRGGPLDLGRGARLTSVGDAEPGHLCRVERDPAHPRRLETVWGVGYRFVP